jgi:hypothetical protein
MKHFADRSSRLRFAAIVLVLLLAGVGVVIVLRPAPAAVKMIPFGEATTLRRPSLLDRVKAGVPMWVWKLKYSLFGPVDTILLDNAIVSFKDWSESGLSDLALGNPTFTETNGLRVWIIAKSELMSVRGRVEQTPGIDIVSAPKVSSGIGTPSSVSVGRAGVFNGIPVQSGVQMNLLPRARRDSIDLTAVVVVSEILRSGSVATVESSTNIISLQTNLAFAARFQIPKDCGVFLLDAARAVTNKSRFGVIISPTLQRAKK